MQYLDVYIAVSEGNLLGAYSNEEQAESRVEAETENNFNYAVEEYGLDPDEDADTATYIAGYDCGAPYVEFVTVELDDSSKTIETSQGDCFTVGEIVDLYSGYIECDGYCRAE